MYHSPVSPSGSLIEKPTIDGRPPNTISINAQDALNDTPSSPPFEPLTPGASDDECAPHNEASSLRAAARTLAHRLRCPININAIFNGILRVTDSEACELDESLSQALGRLPKPERSRISSFARRLSRIYEQGRNDDDDVEAAAQLVVAPPFVVKSRSNMIGGTGKVPRSNCEPDADNSPLEQASTQATGGNAGRTKQPIAYASEANPRTKVICRDPHTDGTTADLPGSAASDTLTVTDPREVATQKTPSPAQTAQEAVSSESSHKLRPTLLEQSVVDFIAERYQQIWQFSLPGNSPDTYKALFDSLRIEADNEEVWSDGSRWMALVKAGDSDRCMGSIRYALTACGFARWHKSQVVWLERAAGMATQKATNAVFERMLGHRPEKAGAEQEGWKRQRQRLSTHLTRGKKWLRLLDAFGWGILFKDAWDLVKSRDVELDILIQEGPHQLQKMAILRLLEEQMTSLLSTGKTNPEEFRQQLVEEGFLDPCTAPSATGDEELDAFLEEVRGSSMSDRLVIRHANFQFDIASLQRLGSTRWLNDDIILACLHLSSKLPFVRVGFSIPIHRQTRAGGAIPRPFERAAQQISEWHASQQEGDSHAESPLVCFFPLFQRHNHFSLLEISERDGKIYHYDSMSSGKNADVKMACNKEFPGFQYVEKGKREVTQQTDAHSCGPFVIKNGCDRMIGRPAKNGAMAKYDPTELRGEALHILRSAWKDGALTVAVMPKPGRKRKSHTGDHGKANKRRRAEARLIEGAEVIEIE
ncbi:hypothetical protein FALBO_4852 [Fusarium albosuccineum]|uniref:Ubiquitin-like protease family profile domain-containing protein n=1 Tax=Fusarium albosuccineum TaxID=1237068 RepID=A0A8H4LHI4_9HYPO|nr:hypothetical protein FALBO_4852 [Fusarium albosuccineum]